VYKNKNYAFMWLKSQVVFDICMLKYGLVGCAGIAVNLGAMAGLLIIGFNRGWIASAFATVLSTISNFFLHNQWTFSDGRHKRLAFVRGFISFAFVSAVGMSITATLYVVFTRGVAHLSFLNFQANSLFIPLSCQLIAVLVAACTTYLLNRQFTWPGVQSDAADIA
jgi:putative flippase GtrA